MDDLPKCQIPGCQETAGYDEKTKMGPWAYLCETHHEEFGVGIGTKLEKRVKVAYKSDQVPVVMVPLTLDSIATVNCPHCNEPRDVEPDANYTVTCESCGNQYKVVSPI